MKVFEKRRGEALVELTRSELITIEQSLMIAGHSPNGPNQEIGKLTRDIQLLIDDPVLKQEKIPES